MTNNIGKIQKVPLRELWKTEPDFTKWLEENIDYLNDVIGFDIAIESREENVGPFRVDLYGEDGSGNRLIIENQLEKTDHDHLGKVITYLTNLEANTAIWITSDPVEEHVKAIDWFNETTSDDMAFYLVKLEAVKIGNQPSAAPLFTVVVRPTVERKQIGKEKKQNAERHTLRKRFWSSFLEASNAQNDLCSNLSPGTEQWIGIGMGMGGMNLNFRATGKYARAEIYINRGVKEENKRVFEELLKQKEEIERAFGGALIWERRDDWVTSRIKHQMDGVSIAEEDDWEKMISFMVDNGERLYEAFRGPINKLNRGTK